MPGQVLNLPNDFINRTAEQEIFDGLVQFTDNARLLVIEDKKGTGKSTLLEMLQYKCKYSLDCRVSSIQLDDPNINSPFIFIESLRNGFPIDQTFEQFDKFNEARVSKVAAVFSPSSAPINVSGSITASNAVFAGATPELIGAQVNYYANSEWSSAQEEQARRRCIRAFFDDLKAINATMPIVILLDAYERCSGELKTWVVDDFIRTLSFEVRTRPNRLLIVLAGRELPDFRGLLQQRYDSLVKSRRPLSGWQKEHLKDVLRVHGHGNLVEKDLDTVWEKIEQGGFSIYSALLLAEVLKG